ncbi:YlbL family protein [Rhizomonospora bruguierae]|uniref:YlbL family protein n=1 Tax=Rhizomonospora bruguierae TaxID=1581705 RepID=UPI001BD05644|nr:PDZ domain-containing protein [Micromonospora sp. NBRC 107566]
MKRRGVTVLFGAVMVVLLSVGMFMQVPYVVLGPGPTVDTLGSANGAEVIQVTGHATSTSAGQLRLTTVGVQPRANLYTAIRSWFDSEEAVVPRELIYPPGQTQQQVDQQNAQDFKRSQTSAETAALRELGFPVQVRITKVDPGGPSDGALAVGDILTGVDGVPAEDGEKLVELIRGKPAGTTLSIDYTREGRTVTARITTAGNPPAIGVRVEDQQPHPFQLSIKLDEIGGPSAGLMFALGIVDKLTPEDLTGGKIIAGTGEIDGRGAVGPIGGIGQKLVGARDAGARYFLVPADNCAEALANAQPDLVMAKVTSLRDALAALAQVRAGTTPTPCTAG